MTEEINNELELAAQEYQYNHCPMVSMDELSIAFKAGASWQKERIIIKVCKWFNDNACNYFGHMPAYPFIDDLKQAIEDE